MSSFSERRRFASEDDVPRDDKEALSRDTGGVEDPDAPDQASTTGTTPKGSYVGRVAGQDVGYVGETARSAGRRSPQRLAVTRIAGRSATRTVGVLSDTEMRTLCA